MNLLCAVELQLGVQSVVQCRLLQDDSDLILTVWRQTLTTQMHTFNPVAYYFVGFTVKLENGNEAETPKAHQLKEK